MFQKWIPGRLFDTVSFRSRSGRTRLSNWLYCTKCGRTGTQILTFSFGTLAPLWVVGVLFSPCSRCLFLFCILFTVIPPSFMVSLVAVKGQRVFEVCFELIVDVLCGSVDACRPVNSEKKKKRHIHWKQVSFGQPESWTKTPCHAFQSPNRSSPVHWYVLGMTNKRYYWNHNLIHFKSIYIHFFQLAQSSQAQSNYMSCI